MIDHKSIIPLIPGEISGLNDMGLKEKESSYEIIKSYVNENTKKIILPSDKLKKDGCISLGNLLDAESAKRELFEYPIYKGHIKNDLYSDHIPITDYKNTNLISGIYCWEMKDILTCKTITDVISSPLIIDFVSRYLGCLPTCYGVNCMFSSGTSFHGTTSRHRDLDDFKFLSLFVYLDDVGLSNGAHSYDMGSHLGDPSGEKGNEVPSVPLARKIFTGAAGSAFIEDNWGIHNGMTIMPYKRRICLWARYGLYDNYTARYSVGLEEQKTANHTIDMDSKINKYVFRFIAK